MDGMQKDKKAGGLTVKISFIEEGPDGSFLSFFLSDHSTTLKQNWALTKMR